MMSTVGKGWNEDDMSKAEILQKKKKIFVVKLLWLYAAHKTVWKL